MPFHEKIYLITKRSLRVLLVDIPLGIRIYLTAFAIVVVVGASFVFTSIYQRDMSLGINQLLTNRIPAMESAFKIKDMMTLHNNLILTFLITKDSDQLEDAQRLSNDIHIELEKLKIITDNPIILEDIRLLEKGMTRYFSEVKNLITVSKSNELPKEAGWFKTLDWAKSRYERRRELALVSAEGQTYLLRVAALCREIVTLNRSEVMKTRRIMDEMQNRNMKTAMWTIFSAGTFVFFIAFGLAVSLLGSLHELLKGIQAVNEGNLDLEIPIRASGILGKLSNEFNRMARTIRAQQERLLRQNITDELTGAYNQRYFRELLKREIDQAQRLKSHLTLLMIDLDHFKEYNDTFGHELGNDVIRKVSQTITENLRTVDFLARYGGDEFAALLPNSSPAETQAIAKRLLEAVEQCNFSGQQNEKQGVITLSIGGASYPRDAKSTHDLVIKADEALYDAKRTGRNRVRWAFMNNKLIKAV